MESYSVSRVIGDYLVRVGTITRGAPGDEKFSYAESYLDRNEPPLSLSLPLSSCAYVHSDIRPYFDGLLPEGASRDALVAQLSVAENDWLSLLSAVGLDCIGDVVVMRLSEKMADTVAWDEGGYVPLTDGELKATVLDLFTMAKSSEESRLSLAGTQGKVGLAHVPGEPLSGGWLKPLGGAASTHILKTSNMTRIAEFELVCMGAARLCGLNVAEVHTQSFGKPIACVERFDRRIRLDGTKLRVRRLHQEDLAQAFRLSHQSKYLELDGGTYHAIAQMLRRNSSDPLRDLDQLAHLAVFDYLVGNCDNHLKNLSILRDGGMLRLAPAYDIVCTTFFERFSREMGRRLGTTRVIDEVMPSDFAVLSRDLGLGAKRMQRICGELVEQVTEAVMNAGEEGADVLETLPFVAEDLVDDMQPRAAVVDAYARGIS